MMTLLMQDTLKWELEQIRIRAVEALEREGFEVPDCMRESLLAGKEPTNVAELAQTPIRYKLVFDEVFGGNTETDAYTRMGRAGEWDGDWWTPGRAAASRAHEKIEREGYIVMEEERSQRSR